MKEHVVFLCRKVELIALNDPRKRLRKRPNNIREEIQLAW